MRREEYPGVNCERDWPRPDRTLPFFRLAVAQLCYQFEFKIEDHT
jgi:hypothetical protein